jgi:hypothetical protein
MASGKMTGIHLALIFFVMLSVILGISTYRMYQRSVEVTLMLNSSRDELHETKSDLISTRKKLNDANAKRNSAESDSKKLQSEPLEAPRE